MKVKDFYVGLKTSSPLLVIEAHEGVSNNGSLYLNLVLGDNTGEVEAKIWDYDSLFTQVFVGQIRVFDFTVISFRNHHQLKIINFSDVLSNYCLEDFVSASPTPQQELLEELERILQSFTNPVIRQVVEGLIQKHRHNFIVFPAAVKNHHNYLYGLLEHSVTTSQMAEFVARRNPWLHRDLLVAGCLIHDLGKVIELSSNIACKYTKVGKLMGHLTIIAEEISLIAQTLQVSDTEEVLMLKHIVLSHHGKMEYGSAVLPQIPEAEIVHLLDNLDARLNTLYKEMNTLEAGEYSGRVFSLEYRSFYKHQL